MATATATERQQLKILICGDVNGQFDVLLGRLDTLLQDDGPFDLMFVCGEFFGPNKLNNQRILTGQLCFPLPTFIIGPIKPENARFYPKSADVELTHNLIFLGRKGYYRNVHGLSVAYLSGLEGEYVDDCHFTKDSVVELTTQVTNRSDFENGVDILLTNQWPKGVGQNSPTSPDVRSEDQLNPSLLISKLAADLKPRYHFVAHSSRPFERAAYRNHATLLGAAQHTTRFVGLARVGNPMKQKYLYAFDIQPMSSMEQHQLVAEPLDCTDFPYGETLKELEEGYALKRTSVANDNEPRRRGEAKIWIKDSEFQDRESALKFVKNENCWSKTGGKDTSDGRKVYYRCKKVPKVRGNCSASIYLLYHAEKESVTLWRTEAAHDHDRIGNAKVQRGLDLKTGDDGDEGDLLG